MAGCYCVDTSSFIQLRHYPRPTFPSLWAYLEELAGHRRLLAPHEVLRELKAGDDQIAAWAMSQPHLFWDLDAEQGLVLSEVLAAHPDLAGSYKIGPFADPLVVALALERTRNDMMNEYCVVTEERLKGDGSIRIPNLCAAYKLGCTRLLGVLEAEHVAF